MAMLFAEIATFDVTRARLEWPWIAFASSGTAIAYAASLTTITTLTTRSVVVDDVRERVASGVSFELPADLALDSGLTAFALAAGDRLAITGRVDGAWVVATLTPSGESRRTRVDDVLGAGHEVKAIAFDRGGRRIWLATENPTETAIALLEAESLALVGVERSAALPRPGLHELHLHPQDDAVLLLAACGEEGTFARVVGYAGDVVSAVPTALDAGGIAAGFVGFSADGARVHLAEADELRTHAWPILSELSSVPFDDDFISSFSGAVLGTDILVDGNDADTTEDAVMVYDRSGIRGAMVRVAPSGMWAGRLGAGIVTVAAKGDPAVARVLVRRDPPAAAVTRSTAN